MQVELRDPAGLIPYPGNARVNDGAVAEVAASIKRFGFRQPIIVDVDGVIVAGHTRHRAALALALPAVPVVVADALTPDEVAAYRLADNRLAESASWDWGLLTAELRALAGEGISLDATGLPVWEVETLLAAEPPRPPAEAVRDERGRRRVQVTAEQAEVIEQARELWESTHPERGPAALAAICREFVR